MDLIASELWLNEIPVVKDVFLISVKCRACYSTRHRPLAAAIIFEAWQYLAGSESVIRILTAAMDVIQVQQRV